MQKTVKNKWLVLCLILSNIVFIAMVTVVPLFITATEQRLFQEEFPKIQEKQNIFPTVMQLRYSFDAVSPENRYSSFIETKDTVLPGAIADMGLPVLFGTQTLVVSSLGTQPAVAREEPAQNRGFHLAAPDYMEQHINIIHGRMPADELIAVDRHVFDNEFAGTGRYSTFDNFAGGYIIEALAANDIMFIQNLMLEELLIVRDVHGPDGELIYVRIVGIFETAENSDAYWSISPITINTSLFVSEQIISEQFISDYSHQIRLSAIWTRALDWRAMHVQSVPRYLQAADNSVEILNESGNVWEYSINFRDLLEGDQNRTQQLDITVWVLQIPIYTMLALFMYMVTKQILVLDSNDISVLKSRGASRLQILGVYALQNLFIGAVSLPLGIGFGMILCQVIGSSSGFLELVGRAPLDVRVTEEAILFGTLGMIVSYLYILLPVIRLSKVAIVEKKVQSARKLGTPVWKKYFLDVAALAFSIYILYNFNLQREFLMTTLPDSRGFDPFLFFGSSLFIVGVSLFLLRLYPYLMKLVFIIGRRKFGSAIYAAVLKVSRSGGGEQFIMLFLIFTVAVGIFSAQSARTLNQNNEHRIRYLSGADLKLSEVWDSNLFTDEEIRANPMLSLYQPEVPIYAEPDFSRFQNLAEVDAVARVHKQNATVRLTGTSITVANSTLMGIESKSFGETAWFRDDFTMIHVNYFLNALAQNPNGVLLSSGFRELGYSVGSAVNINAPQRHGAPLNGDFEVVGFIDYWPSFGMLETKVLPETGEIVQEMRYLAVANLGHLQSLIGTRPYEVWMRTNTQSHRFIHDFINENDVRISSFYDTNRTLSEILLDPIVQSTNGLLTIGFIMTMLVCFVGFLIYWILSIRERLLQFGVFRAMGMGLRGILAILISEQMLITLSALIIGGLVGELASQLFIPMLQLSYAAADQVIPMLVATETMDFILIYSMLGFMLVLCTVVLVRFALRINVTQVLKLGED
jgi:putative ABC transport system permease protein